MNKYVVWFSEVDHGDLAIVGGKGANLGEMSKAGFPVPPGFIVTSKAYYHFLEENNLRPKIKKIIENLDPNNSKQLQSKSLQIKKVILNSHIPKDVAHTIAEYYQQLPHYFHSKEKKVNLKSHIKSVFAHEFVAVRSSATAEDLPEASFAGQQETYLNVVGEANLLEKVRACWASLFEARAIFYRVENKFDHFKVGIAVPVQKMVNSDTSGVMFTVDPLTSDKKKVVIEAIYGLGEFIVQGIETPDQYLVDKSTLRILTKTISHQNKMMVKQGKINITKNVPRFLLKTQKITNKQIEELARLGKRLEHHYYFPQDIEWAIEKNNIFIVQTRPITTIGKREKISEVKIEDRKPFLTGVAASPGIVTGRVKIIKSAKEINKIKSGDILTAMQTNPDFVPAMKKAVAVVTERGGRTSHAAIVSRELGIPAVVGVAKAISTLKNDMIITVDGAKGELYKGNIIKSEIKHRNLMVPYNAPTSSKTSASYQKTATHVYVNLAEPERAYDTSSLPVDGVGLLRAEFMIANIGTHPKKLIKDKKQQIFINTLSEGIGTICKHFSPRPVVYRTTDFKTNEYRNLKGGVEFEPQEPNPMLGFRGAYRYIVDSHVFELELKAIREVRNKMGYKNLWMMIPYVRTVDELIKVKRILAAEGLMRSPSFKLWMMVEIPSNVILLDKFIDCGIDGVSIGSNDLTMLILGTDRDNSEVAGEFNEKNEAVLWALERIVKICHKRKVTSSLCGQAASDYPDLVEKLVEWGITSVSVNPDAAVGTRNIIAEAERKLVNRK